MAEGWLNLFSLIHKKSEALKDVLNKTFCRGGGTVSGTCLPSRRPIVCRAVGLSLRVAVGLRVRVVLGLRVGVVLGLSLG